MTKIDFYIENSYEVSKIITKKYSTSFSLATNLLKDEERRSIYAIYGFVRLADEIVDSFHGYDKEFLLKKLEDDLYYALENSISTNVILMAFADTVRKYDISHDYIDAFMNSMKFDLTKSKYTTSGELNQYIYGSADVVGLMCLKIFCKDDDALFQKLKEPAQRLGSAFQKVNFLRDLKEDLNSLGRSYFPEIADEKFDKKTKKIIENSIEKDFEEAWKGVVCLPGRSKLAVALAYHYFEELFKKIKRTAPEKVLKKRIRIPNIRKYLIIVKTIIKM